MARRTTPKNLSKWVAYSPAKYRDTLQELVHFSTKTVNSNALPCGIRLGEADYVDWPYVAVSCLGPGEVPCDYFRGANDAGVVKQALDALSGEPLAEKYANLPDVEELAAIQRASVQLGQAYAAGTGQVGIRLRQIIVQDGDGQDVALTPLQSAGFSHVLVNRLERELAEQPEGAKRYRARGYLGIGGANPQNVGRYVRDMWRPLWFQPPQEDGEIRQALAIHYRGIPLTPPPRLVQGYQDWRQALMALHGGRMPSDRDTRAQEAEFLRSVTAAIQGRAERARDLLNRYRDALPGQNLTDPDLPPHLRALLDSESRYRGWKRDLALALRREILDFRRYRHGETERLGIGDQDAAPWIGLIEEAL